MDPKMRGRNFKIDDKSLTSVLLIKFIRTLMRLKKSHKRMMTILITIKTFTRKFKIIACKNNSNKCSIFLASLYSTESIHQIK